MKPHSPICLRLLAMVGHVGFSVVSFDYLKCTTITPEKKLQPLGMVEIKKVATDGYNLAAYAGAFYIFTLSMNPVPCTLEISRFGSSFKYLRSLVMYTSMLRPAK